MRKTLAISAAIVVIMGLSMGCGSGGKLQGEKEGVDTPETILPVNDIFSGEYEVKGPDYEAKLTIAKNNQGYHLEWTFPDGSKYLGKGIALDGILGAVYDVGDGSASGVVAYKKSGDGISGLWTPADGSNIFYEKTKDAGNLKIGQLDVRGEYSLTGTNDDSTEYKGSLKISELGPVLAAHWISGPNEIYGTGFVIDDVLILGYGNEEGVGVVVYEIHGTHMNGFWLFSLYEELTTSYPIGLGTENAKK